MCALGILLALHERFKSGKGQVVDAAMVDGVAYLSSMCFLTNQLGHLKNGIESVGTNLLDTGAHFYEVYTCKDGKHFSIGAIEPQFYKLLLKGMGLEEKKDNLPRQMDQSKWPEMKQLFAKVFATKTQQEWTGIFHGVDACAFPVLSMADAIHNEHNKQRKTFLPSKEFKDFGLFEPAAAPKLSRTPGCPPRKLPTPGGDTAEVLGRMGYSKDRISTLLASNNVVDANTTNDTRAKL